MHYRNNHWTHRPHTDKTSLARKFFWGTATSSFQIEGHIENDFTEWEKLGKFVHNNEKVMYENGSNHWMMWEDDFKLMKKLNVNAYRFSFEWARIEPRRNTFDRKALDQYERMVDWLLKHQIEPFLTIHHFTHPTWFHEYSPWHDEKSKDVFLNYVDKIVRIFKDRIKYFITFNEVLVWVMAGYGEGNFPPGHKNLDLMMNALYNILKTHRETYDLIKSYNENAEVGVAKHFIVFKRARDWFFLDKEVQNRIHYFFNVMELDAFKNNILSCSLPPLLKFEKEIDLNNKIDFWGINYYYRLYTKFKFSLKNPFYFYTKNPQTDTGWEIYPKGLYKIIKLVSTYRKKMFITENGIATQDDELRKKFIKRHIKFLIKAIENGFNVQGYFYWSLIDNYEWLFGKSKRFGLISVDYEKNFERHITQNGYYYSQLISKYHEKITM